MRNVIALTARELRSLWYSPILYVIGALFLMLQGFVFWFLVLALNDPRADAAITISQAFFGPTFFYTTALLITIPFLTMRTFSEEKRTGTLEMLLTAPVTERQIVLAKFFGAWIAYILLWTLTIVFFLFLRRHVAIDWGPVASGYLGTWLLGGTLIAIGILASSLTRNQVISAFLTFVILLFFFSIGILDWFVRDPETSRTIRYLSLLDHLIDFSKGILDTRPLVLYLSISSIALFLAGRIIAHPRWRV